MANVPRRRTSPGLLLLPKKDTKKSTMAKRVGQITPICYPKTTRAYCCTKPNWIGSSRLWNTRPRPHCLGLPAYIFAARKKIAGRYFRGKIFSREDFFAGSYFHGKIFSRENIFAWTVYSRKYLLAKIFLIPFSRNFLPAKIIVLYIIHIHSYTVVPALGDPRRERPPAMYGHVFNVPTHFNVPIRPSDERPPAMYGHFCLVPRVSVHDRYYCTLNPGSQILNGTSNIQFQTIKCKFCQAIDCA